MAELSGFGTQDVLSGVLIYLMKRCGTGWGWKDLSDILADPITISDCLREIKHAAAQHIQLGDSGPSPQTQGVLGSIRAPLKSLDQIAGYWPEAGGIPLVSSFISDKTQGVTLVLAARPDYTEVATPLIAGLMALMMRRGLALPDDKARRVWFVLDELGALPKISKLVDLITLGRSKGLCLIAGTQDLGRLESVYGKEQVQTISSQFGTHLIGRLGDSTTAKWAAELFGQQRIERLQISENQNGAYTGGFVYQPAVSTTWQQSDKAALLDSDFLHLPKATGSGFYMWARLTDDAGSAVLGKVKYPINSVPTPFPACVERRHAVPVPQRPEATSGSGGAGMQPQQEQRRDAQTDAEVIADLEELEALIAQHEEPEQVQEPEQESESGGDEVLNNAAEEVALKALGIDGGANVLLDVAEAMASDGEKAGSGSVTQSHSTKKKKKRRLSMSAAQDI